MRRQGVQSVRNFTTYDHVAATKIDQALVVNVMLFENAAANGVKQHRKVQLLTPEGVAHMLLKRGTVERAKNGMDERVNGIERRQRVRALELVAHFIDTWRKRAHECVHGRPPPAHERHTPGGGMVTPSSTPANRRAFGVRRHGGTLQRRRFQTKRGAPRPRRRGG